jgi:hypothetical protein
MEPNWHRNWSGPMSQMGQTLPNRAFGAMSGLPPGSDRTADIPDRQLRANKRLMRRSIATSFNHPSASGS